MWYFIECARITKAHCINSSLIYLDKKLSNNILSHNKQ